MQTLYSPLNKPISLLCIDDDLKLLDFYGATIGSHPLYNVIKASSAKMAQQLIQTRTIHMCILDLSIDDINKDEFYLLKKFARRIPFIIMSGSADMERAFEASIHGASGMIAKPPNFASMKFWFTLSEIFLKKVILPEISENTNSVIKNCCEILKKHVPDSVCKWASLANITDSYLRRIWSGCFGTSPKHVLFLYRLYTNAFRYYNTFFLTEICSQDVVSVANVKQSEYERMINYYLQNKKKLDEIRDSQMKR